MSPCHSRQFDVGRYNSLFLQTSNYQLHITVALTEVKTTFCSMSAQLRSSVNTKDESS